MVVTGLTQTMIDIVIATLIVGIMLATGKRAKRWHPERRGVLCTTRTIRQTAETRV